MASSPWTAPSFNQSPPPPQVVAQPPPGNASPPQYTASPSPPPPRAASPPPLSPPPTQSQSPPTPPNNQGSTPPNNQGSTPPAQSQSPPTPSNNQGSTPPNNQGSIPPSFNNSPPPRGSASEPVFSPPPPGRNNSDSPPSRDSSRSPPLRSSDRPPSSSFRDQDTSSSSSDSINAGLVAAIVVGGVVLIALLIVSLTCMRRKKKRPKYYIDPERTPKGGNQYYNGNVPWNSPLPVDHALPPGVIGGWGTTPPPPVASGNFSSPYVHQSSMPPLSPNMGGFGSQSQFTYEELATATGGFAQANLLGQGGFGLVHKGILPSGKEVAVKSLKSGSGQGEREFQGEVEIISRVHHRHLVSLVGYCIAGGRKMLVYEFVPNKTLEFHLHGQAVMDWTTRLRIALGSAKGLAYLHEDCHPRIIHRDIKAANILIDSNFEAMVADFGLAKLTTDNHTHVSTRVMGTFGYLAPEYASSGKLSEKSDVFSFGVMLLELITGRRPVDPHNVMEDSLVDWAKPLLTRAQQEGIYDELVDPRLEGKFVVREMARMVACVAASVRHSARRRPKMSQIVRALEGDYSLDALSELGEQGPYVTTGQTTEMYDTRTYDADMMKFRKMVMMSSQEFNGSDYGATSEYGLNPSSSSGDSSGKQTPDLHRL